jgi:hypothetical protein
MTAAPAHVVLWVGNGFTISAARHAGLASQTQTPPFFGDDIPARYLPRAGDDRFSERPLWSSEIWPELSKVRRDFKGDENCFFASLAQIKAATTGPGNRIGAESFQGVAFELRFYLWQMFRYYDRLWTTTGSWEKLHDWTWMPILRHLSAQTTLTVVSYNYDVIAERAHDRFVGPPRFKYQPQQSLKLLSARKHYEGVLLKPHGSIAWNPIGIGGPANPWLLGGPRYMVIEDSVTSRGIYPPNGCTMFPDLVPPGHAENHLLDVMSDAVPATVQAIENCAALIVCGFSAQSPDDVEADGYFSKLKRNTPVIHIDVKEKEGKTKAEELLRRYASHYEFLPAEKLTELIPRLNAALSSVR